MVARWWGSGRVYNVSNENEGRDERGEASRRGFYWNPEQRRFAVAPLSGAAPLGLFAPPSAQVAGQDGPPVSSGIHPLYSGALQVQIGLE